MMVRELYYKIKTTTHAQLAFTEYSNQPLFCCNYVST